MMKPFREVLERYDRLWEQAETFIESRFAGYRCTDRESDGDAPGVSPGEDAIAVPDLKELSTAITALKRIQDARRAIHLDALKWEARTPDGEETRPDDDEKVSRILQRLEEDGEACEPEEPDEEAM
jgi:hypothetical protein